MKKWLINILIATDQFFNSVFGGDPQETISSRAGKRDGRKIIPTVICWFLERLDPGHCKDSINESEGDDEVI